MQSMTPAPVTASSRFRSLFLHEIAMTLMLCQILLRLALSSHPFSYMAAYILVIAIYVQLILIGRRTLSPLLNRLRLFWSIVAMNFAFTSIRGVIPALGLSPMDAALARLDTLIVGGDLSIHMQQFYSKPLTEIMSLGYMLFIVFLFFSFLHYGIRGDLERFREYCTGLFTLYALGITGYTLVPAQGPLVYYADELTVPVQGYLFTWLNHQMVAAGSAGFDVFPSLHVGVGLFMLLFFRKHDRRIWRWYLIPFILLSISTIYLRYHYFIDIICGAALSIACFAIRTCEFPSLVPANTRRIPHEHH